MEQSNFTINSIDRKGEPIKITCEGIDDQQLAHFGGLDLAVKAARTLIAATNNPMSFPEKEGDYYISDKVVALLLNEVGELIRNTSPEPDYIADISNIELVKDFLEHLPENREVTQVIEEDNQLIQEANKREREEEDKIWQNIMSDFNQNK
ncbi:hypothetical protein [Robertmurraya sp.]|uniref:hypothetical protein n=1 Tax=Robertmurraya sp. TaxID=2837525 RepID=UPI00370489B0